MDGSAHKALFSSKVVDGFGVVAFQRGGIREEVEVLRTLDSLARYVECHPHLRIVLDLSGVEYVSCAGLARLIRLLKAVRKNGGTLRLSGLQPFVSEVFRAVRLDELFSIHASPEAAIQSPETELETESAL